MPRTFVRQYQSYKTDDYADDLAAGSTLESASTDLETDLNAIRSQIKRYAGETKWYTDKTGRDLKTTASDLLDIENKKLLFRSQILTDITVPAAAKSVGTLNCVSKAEMVNGEKVVINDGTRVVNFWSNVSGAYSPPGGYDATNIDVDVNACTDADSVKAVYISAINGATIDITASSGGTGIVSLLHDINGAWNYAITHTVADTDFTVDGMKNGAGNMKVLVQSTGETPSEVAAVDAGTANGALVKVLTTDVGMFSLAEIGGANALNPKNLMVVRDATTGDPILSGGKTIWALFQGEAGIVDGNAFNDTTKQCQLSFVKENATADDLIAVPTADIAGKSINYSYVLRINLDAVPEQAFLSGAFVDQSASVDVTLDNAIDNQSGPATQAQDIEVQITDTKSWAFEDSTGTDKILEIAALAAGDQVNMKVETFTVDNAGLASFTGALEVNTGANGISIGVIADTINAAGDLILNPTLSLKLQPTTDLVFTDQYQAGSGYSTDLVLSDLSTEWDTYKTNFGEVSLLNAISQAYSKAKHDKAVAATTGAVNANDNISGTTTPVNLTNNLLDYDGKNFVDDVDVYLNGVLLRNGANAGANHDVYPGTDPTYGDICLEYKIKSGDQITMVVW
jgi:hypothetical protein